MLVCFKKSILNEEKQKIFLEIDFFNLEKEYENFRNNWENERLKIQTKLNKDKNENWIQILNEIDSIIGNNDDWKRKLYSLLILIKILKLECNF